MVDWTKPMQQTYEYYIVNPNTWKDEKLITTVKSATINRDSEVDTLGSATIDIVDSIGECYIRIYLITVQNGVRDKHPLGTFLVQTPSSNYDGKTRNVSMDAYTPLLELKEKQPDIGYYVPKTVYYKVEERDGIYEKTEEEVDLPSGNAVEGVMTETREQVFEQIVNGVVSYYCMSDTVMSLACRLLRSNILIGDASGDDRQYARMMRAPIIDVECFNPLHYDFVADTDDTWFSFINDLIANADYRFDLDELGRVRFSPRINVDTMQPVWTYTDDNSSILYPEITMNHDLYGIPNVVEVLYSVGNETFYARVVNDDPNSPTSIQNRGREITYRVTNPELAGMSKKDADLIEASQKKIKDYADRVLKELSTIEYTISYSHGYCPVRLGDCVRLNYERAGIKNIKAKVISQSISCEPGCKVTETAVFTTKLWR